MCPRTDMSQKSEVLFDRQQYGFAVVPTAVGCNSGKGHMSHLLSLAFNASLKLYPALRVGTNNICAHPYTCVFSVHKISAVPMAFTLVLQGLTLVSSSHIAHLS